MGFKLTLNDKRLSVTDIDILAAEYWNVPIREDFLSTPFLNRVPVLREQIINNSPLALTKVHVDNYEYTTSWYTIIGPAITRIGIHETKWNKVDWKLVKQSASIIYELSEGAMEIDDFMSPFINLINYFDAQHIKVYAKRDLIYNNKTKSYLVYKK